MYTVLVYEKERPRAEGASSKQRFEKFASTMDQAHDFAQNGCNHAADLGNEWVYGIFDRLCSIVEHGTVVNGVRTVAFPTKKSLAEI